jgi:hypothetical protein
VFPFDLFFRSSAYFFAASLAFCAASIAFCIPLPKIDGISTIFSYSLINGLYYGAAILLNSSRI